MGYMDEFLWEVRTLNESIKEAEAKANRDAMAMEWYVITYKDGTVQTFQANSAGYEDDVFITFLEVKMSDVCAESFLVAKSEVLTMISKASGEIIDDAKKLLEYRD